MSSLSIRFMTRLSVRALSLCESMRARSKGRIRWQCSGVGSCSSTDAMNTMSLPLCRLRRFLLPLCQLRRFLLPLCQLRRFLLPLCNLRRYQSVKRQSIYVTRRRVLGRDRRGAGTQGRGGAGKGGGSAGERRRRRDEDAGAGAVDSCRLL
jgi:hypothetical protein